MLFTEELKARRLVDQLTYPDELEPLLNRGGITFYVGFDCTADSLTIGHYMIITLMRRFQEAGHLPICLIGDGTTLIGDPTGRNDMRSMLTREDISHNASRFREQLSRFLVLDGKRGWIVQNGDWLHDLNMMDFMREIGVHYLVNHMVNFDCYASRMNDGLTLFEFMYMPMQGYDFLQLYRKYGCTLEVGGSDQWSNMLGGYELVRKLEKDKVYLFTMPLLTKPDGSKMGKSQGGAIWLDPDKTSPYDLYQYFRNAPDDMVETFFLRLTFLPVARIEQILREEEINRQKEILAFEVTRDIHGEEAAQQSLETSRALFGSGTQMEHMPEYAVTTKTADGIGILTLLTLCGLTRSNSEARSLIQQGGITLDGIKIDDPKFIVPESSIQNGCILQKGKKKFLRIFKG